MNLKSYIQLTDIMSRSFWMWNCNFVIIFICCNLVCCVVSSQTDWSVWLNILRINEWALRYMIVRTVCASITVRFVFMFISIFFHSKEEVYNLYAIFSTNLGEKYKESNEKKWNNAYTLTDHSFIFIILPFKAQKIYGSSKSGTKKNLNLHENSSVSTRDIYLMCLARLANWSRYIIPYRSYKVHEYSARSVSIHRIILIYVC